VYGYDIFVFRHFPIIWETYMRRLSIPYLFPSACKIMEDLDSITQEKLEICRGLTGEERSEFIENHLDDYYFAMNIVTNRKVLRHYRELFTKLIKDFGH
jgi:hypothetical protein